MGLKGGAVPVLLMRVEINVFCNTSLLTFRAGVNKSLLQLLQLLAFLSHKFSQTSSMEMVFFKFELCWCNTVICAAEYVTLLDICCLWKS